MKRFSNDTYPSSLHPSQRIINAQSSYFNSPALNHDNDNLSLLHPDLAGSIREPSSGIFIDPHYGVPNLHGGFSINSNSPVDDEWDSARSVITPDNLHQHFPFKRHHHEFWEPPMKRGLPYDSPGTPSPSSFKHPPIPSTNPLTDAQWNSIPMPETDDPFSLVKRSYSYRPWVPSKYLGQGMYAPTRSSKRTFTQNNDNLNAALAANRSTFLIAHPGIIDGGQSGSHAVFKVVENGVTYIFNPNDFELTPYYYNDTIEYSNYDGFGKGSSYWPLSPFMQRPLISMKVPFNVNDQKARCLSFSVVLSDVYRNYHDNVAGFIEHITTPEFYSSIQKTCI